MPASSLDADEQWKRNVALPLFAALCLTSAVCVVVYLPVDSAGDAGLLLWLAATAFGVARILLKKRVEPRATGMVTAVIALGVCLADWSAASNMTPRLFPVQMLVLDALMVCGGSSAWRVAVVAGTLLWLTAVQVQSAVDYGLWDASNWGAESDHTPQVCACAHPPCELSPVRSSIIWIAAAVVFTVDAALVQVHFERLRETSERRQCTDRVLSLLAKFETAEATRTLASSQGLLSETQRTVLEQLTSTLTSSKPYLPDMFFKRDSPLATVLDLRESESGEPGYSVGSGGKSTGVWSASGDDAAECGVQPVQPQLESINPLAASTCQSSKSPSSSSSGCTAQSRPPGREPRGWRKKRSKGHMTLRLPQMKARSVSLLCARLYGLRERFTEIGAKQVEQQGKEFLTAVLDAGHCFAGVMHSFNDAAAVLSFGANDVARNACTNACRCALTLRGVVIPIDVQTSTSKSLLKDGAKDPGFDCPAVAALPPRAVPQFGSVIQGIDWDVLMTGEVGTAERRGFSLIGPAVSRVTTLCDQNIELGTLILCSEQQWDRVQHEGWLTAREFPGNAPVFEILPVDGRVNGPAQEALISPYFR